MDRIIHVISKPGDYWKTDKIEARAEIETDDILQTTGIKKQEILGFGICFNELGWDALQRVEERSKEEFLKELFSEEGCGFNSGRIPIGANDFSLQWYSCDEEEEDYDLKSFSIERDKKYTIPFVRKALQYCPDMAFFASPWSPPTWMKTKKVYNYGRIRMEEKVLDAYARYFVKFVQAYEREGIHISMVHVQNEPMADQKFPSCLWHGCDMRDFIKGYLGPQFRKNIPETEIWLGTINGPFIDFRWPGYGAPYEDFYDQFANTVLSDPEARQYISGVGVQWGGKHQVEQIEASWPEMRIMQTESECGDGKNEWEQAEYIFMLMWHFLRHGAERYLYWNSILLEGGISSWGWKQNSLATVNEETGEITLQPEFYLMKHVSHFVKKGARFLDVKGHWTGNALVFENPDQSLVVVVMNSMHQDRDFVFEHGNTKFSSVIEAHSIHTFVIGRKEEENETV